MQVGTREIFWQIQGVGLFYGVALIAVAVFFWGVIARVRFVLRGARVRLPGARRLGWRAAMVDGCTHRWAGGFVRARFWHLLVFWGWWTLALVTLWVMVSERLRPGLFAGFWYRAISLLGEAGGVCLLLGACVGLVSAPGGISRGRRAERIAAFGTLIVLVMTGFLLEGLRFLDQADPYPAWSAVGWCVSRLLGVWAGEWTERTFPALWWFHSLLALAFVAWIPFSRGLSHLVFLLPHRALQPVQPRAPLPEPDFPPPPAEEAPEERAGAGRLGIETARDATRLQRLGVLSCMECGRCDQVCPAFLSGQPLSPRRLLGGFRDRLLAAWAVQGSGEGCDRPGNEPRPGKAVPGHGEGTGRRAVRVMDGLDPDALWACRACLACEEVCPAGIGHVSQVLDLRRAEVLHHGRLPGEAAAALRNLSRTGNPYGAGAEERQAWLRRHAAAATAAPGDGARRLLWVGCFPPGDAQKPRVLDCLVSLLNQAGVAFSLPAETVSCCGEPARMLGDEDLFRRHAGRQTGWLRETGVRELLVHCPHCHHVLKERCSGMRPAVAVVHTSELFRDLTRRGRLVVSPPGGSPGTQVYHDPCFLGRYHGRYEPVREILRSIRGQDVVEPTRTREAGFCCGAGGGHFFMDLDRGERPSVLRMRELVACRPASVAVSCHFCFSMLDDACRRLSGGDQPRVADWVELLREAVAAP